MWRFFTVLVLGVIATLWQGCTPLAAPSRDAAPVARIRWTLPAGSMADRLAMSPRGERLAIGCRDGVVRIVDTATWAVSATLGEQGWPVAAVAFSPDGELLASVDEPVAFEEGRAPREGHIRVWALRDRRVRVLHTYDPNWMPGGVEVLHAPSVAFSPDGSAVFWTRSLHPSVVVGVCSLVTGERTEVPLTAGLGPRPAIALDGPGGLQFLAAQYLWRVDVQPLRLRRVLPLAARAADLPTATAYDAQDVLIGSAESLQRVDKLIVARDIRSGEIRRDWTLKDVGGAPHGPVAMSPDGRTLLVVTGKGVVICSADGQTVGRLPVAGCQDAVFSAGGEFAITTHASGDGDGCTVWRVSSIHGGSRHK